MPPRHVSRGGEYVRVAGVDWTDPLDGSYSMARGGRWNAPGAFPIVYLCATKGVARAYLSRKYHGFPYSVDEFAPGAGPDLVTTSVPHATVVDVVTPAGCTAAGLPQTYPLDATGHEVPWPPCQTLGQRWWTAGEPGIACPSATLVTQEGRPQSAGEELAWFQRGILPMTARVAFDAWFWP